MNCHVQNCDTCVHQAPAALDVEPVDERVAIDTWLPLHAAAAAVGGEQHCAELRQAAVDGEAEVSEGQVQLKVVVGECGEGAVGGGSAL